MDFCTTTAEIRAKPAPEIPLKILSRMFALSLIAAACVASSYAASAAEQVHLAVTGVSSEMHISFVIPGHCPTASVSVSYIAAAEEEGSSISITGFYWTSMKQCMFDGIMTGLSANTKYTYTISSGGVSATFTNGATRDGGKIYAVLADFGLVNDVSIDQLISEARSGGYDAVIHAGDFAYNLEDSGGAVGNGFLNAIAPIASTMPYMTAPGNHESDGDTFAQYRTRFYGTYTLADNSNSTNPLWYSFNDGLVHWVSVDTELWAYGGTPAEIAAQYEWLAADLAAVDRSVTPWVIAYGHKQDWMDSTNFTGLEAIMRKGAVDLYFAGHQHNYQRTLPYYINSTETSCVSSDKGTYTDCSLMTSIIVGSPGCREDLSNGEAPTQYVAQFFEAYGYGHLQVINSTHVHWTWEEIAANVAEGEKASQDDLWLINHSH